MTRLPLVEEIAAVAGLCRDIGLGTVQPVLRNAAHHTLLQLSPLELVARVQSAGSTDVAWSRALREIQVASHLSRCGAPVLTPLVEKAGPYVFAGCVVTFWPFVPDARPGKEADAGLAAETLAIVHDALRDYAGALPSYTRSLDHCWSLLVDDGKTPELARGDRDLLRREFLRLRDVIAVSSGPAVPLHGDAHMGNLLIGPHGPLWIDFEDACLGPREYDIACLPPAAPPLFSEIDTTLVGSFADMRSICVAVWCWADMARSPEAREAAWYHLGRVRQRARQDICRTTSG